MRYRLTLAHAQAPGAPAQRWVNRRNLEEAIDAAQRWLRMSRNIAPAGTRLYDTYLVEVPTSGDGFRLVSSGSAEQTRP